MKHEKLKTYLAENIFPKLSASLYYHSPNHTLDVYEAALLISHEMHLEETLIDKIAAAALLHDIGYIESYRNNEGIACQLARKILPKLGYGEEDCQEICDMIMATCVPQQPKSIGAMVLCDADLDYLGRADFEEGAYRLFQEFFEHKIVQSQQEWDQIQIKFLQAHHYFTEFSKLYREPEKQKHLQKLLHKIEQ